MIPSRHRKSECVCCTIIFLETDIVIIMCFLWRNILYISVLLTKENNNFVTPLDLHGNNNQSGEKVLLYVSD